MDLVFRFRVKTKIPQNHNKNKKTTNPKIKNPKFEISILKTTDLKF